MPNILFRGSKIRFIDLRRDEDGVFARVHLTADYSGPVQEEMGWEPVQESITSCKLVGRLAALNMVLTPADAKLSRNEIQLECSEVLDFQLASVKNDSGDITGHELRFVARTVEAGAVALLENWLRVIGTSPANVKVAYAEQGELEPAAGPEQGNLIEMPDVEEGEGEDGPAVASAVEMAGTTAELKRRRGRPRKSPIPQDPGAPEWRTAEEIAEGTPHHTFTEVM